MSSILTNAVGAENVSLGEFVMLLVLQLDNDQIAMPFQNEEKWHRLFYHLKKQRDVKGRPRFFDRLRFDWDGRFPKAQDLAEYLQALHWNGFVSVANPSYDRLNVDKAVKDSAGKVCPKVEDADFGAFLSNTVKQAADLFK